MSLSRLKVQRGFINWRIGLALRLQNKHGDPWEPGDIQFLSLGTSSNGLFTAPSQSSGYCRVISAWQREGWHCYYRDEEVKFPVQTVKKRSCPRECIQESTSPCNKILRLLIQMLHLTRMNGLSTLIPHSSASVTVCFGFLPCLFWCFFSLSYHGNTPNC